MFRKDFSNGMANHTVECVRRYVHETPPSTLAIIGVLSFALLVSASAHLCGRSRRRNEEECEQ
ncbi:MAG TPA: hypothetical protein VFT64_05490 [Rickettsiales bacterium]|nr:hypothetical protein [Rickettsiales bacterium]